MNGSVFMNEISTADFKKIRDFVKEKYGITLGDEKKSLVYSRLRPVLDELNMDSFSDYYKYLVSDKTGKACITFIDKMTTNHTFFMREVDHFYYFKDTVLPYLEQTVTDGDLRIWCAACSSGEESYTLEIILDEYFKNKGSKWDTELLATDISSSVLNKCVDGIYTKEQVAPLADEWKRSYFKNYDDKHVVVCDEIKKKITYRKFNLMNEKFPFKKKFHVIFCRNAMIYFDNPTKEKLVQRFYDATVEGGYLFIGHSESLNSLNSKYSYIMPAVYRK